MYKILLLTMREVHHNNALNFLKNCSSETYDTIYIDPPFNTGLTRKSARGVGQYQDKFDDFCARSSKIPNRIYRGRKKSSSKYACWEVGLFS
jgi:hypothetical protein